MFFEYSINFEVLLFDTQIKSYVYWPSADVWNRQTMAFRCPIFFKLDIYRPWDVYSRRLQTVCRGGWSGAVYNCSYIIIDLQYGTVHYHGCGKCRDFEWGCFFFGNSPRGATYFWHESIIKHLAFWAKINLKNLRQQFYLREGRGTQDYGKPGWAKSPLPFHKWFRPHHKVATSLSHINDVLSWLLYISYYY